MYTFRGNVAGKFGINAAVVAEYLYAETANLRKWILQERHGIAARQSESRWTIHFSPSIR